MNWFKTFFFFLGVKNEKKIKKSKIEKKEVSDNCKIKCENDTSVGKNNNNLQFQLSFHSLSCVFDNDDGAGHIYFSFIKNIYFRFYPRWCWCRTSFPNSQFNTLLHVYDLVSITIKFPKHRCYFFSLNFPLKIYFPLKIFQYSIRNSHSHHDHVISHLTFLSLLA